MDLGVDNKYTVNKCWVTFAILCEILFIILCFGISMKVCTDITCNIILTGIVGVLVPPITSLAIYFLIDYIKNKLNKNNDCNETINPNNSDDNLIPV